MFAIDCFGVDIREAQIEPNKCVNTQLAECLNKGCVFQCSSVVINYCKYCKRTAGQVLWERECLLPV